MRFALASASPDSADLWFSRCDRFRWKVAAYGHPLVFSSPSKRVFNILLVSPNDISLKTNEDSLVAVIKALPLAVIRCNV